VGDEEEEEKEETYQEGREVMCTDHIDLDVCAHTQS
jgi:hypothetical protein